MIVTIECDSPNVVFGNSPMPTKVVVELTKDGIDGKSAYLIAVENGYTGTEAEFAVLLNSIGDKQDKNNWWALIIGATNRELLVKDSQGKKYAYTYGNVVLYRYIKADKTDDSFFKEIELINKVATKAVVVNI